MTIKTADGRKFSFVALNQTSADLQLRSDDRQLRLIRREGQKFRGTAGATILFYLLACRSDDPERKPGRIRWILVLWMFVIRAVAYLDRVNNSIAGQFLQKDLNLSNTSLGFVFSAFVLGYAIFQFSGAWRTPRGSIWPAPGKSRWEWCGGAYSRRSPRSPACWRSPSVSGFARRRRSGGVSAGNRLVSGWIPVRERGLANGVIFAGVGSAAGRLP